MIIQKWAVKISFTVSFSNIQGTFRYKVTIDTKRFNLRYHNKIKYDLKIKQTIVIQHCEQK